MKKILLHLIVISIGFLGCTEHKKDSEAVEGFFVAVIVSDIEDSIQWYEGTLDFQVMNQTSNDAMGLKQANLKKDNCHLELIELASALDAQSAIDNYSNKTRLIGLFKFGLKLNQFDSIVSQLQQNKAQFKGDPVIDPVSQKKTAIILDPDGNRIQLFEN